MQSLGHHAQEWLPQRASLQSTGTSVLVTQAHRGLPIREERLMPVGHPEEVTFGRAFPCVLQELTLLCLYIAAH